MFEVLFGGAGWTWVLGSHFVFNDPAGVADSTYPFPAAPPRIVVLRLPKLEKMLLVTDWEPEAIPLPLLPPSRTWRPSAERRPAIAHPYPLLRCRSELKKRSSDTLRLQKKARKGQTDGLQSLMDSHMQDVTLRRAELEDVEKKSLRAAMVEERLRYCSFVHMLQPVVHEECEVMSELGHLQVGSNGYNA